MNSFIINMRSGAEFRIYPDGVIYGYKADGRAYNDLPQWVFAVRDSLMKTQFKTEEVE